MQNARLLLFFVFFIFLPIISHAENVKIIVKCKDIEYVEIVKVPDGFPVAGYECKNGCFHSLYYMNDAAARAMIAVYNDKKDQERDLYLGETLMLTMDPMDIDTPLQKKFSSGQDIYYTREEAIARSQKICPGVLFRR